MTPRSKAEVRALVYARISKDQNGEQAGVSRQVEACRDLVDQRGWTLVGEHVDNDISAYSGKRRPQYLAMLAAVEAGEADAIVVWHPDRLTRNPREIEDLLDLVESRRLRVASCQAGEVDLSTPSGRAVARTLVAWAKQESEHKGERQRAQIDAAAKEGKRHGFIPYGWRSEGEAAVVAEITSRLLAGDPVRAISRDLNARGVPTFRGGRWRQAQVRQMALRPSNAGLRSHKGAVMETKGQWPALVSTDDYERLVRLLTDPARTSVRAGRDHVLSGLLTCGKCGAAMRWKNTGSGLAYKCENGDLSISAAPVEEFVLELANRRLNAPDAGAVTEAGDQAYDALTSTLANLRGREADMGRDYAEGLLTGAQVKAATETLAEEIRRVEGRLREAERKSQALRNRGVDVYGLSVPRQRSLLRSLLTLRVLPSTKPGSLARDFDFDRIEVTWK